MPEGKSHTIKVANLPKSKALCTVSNKPLIIVVGLWAATLVAYVFFVNKIIALPILMYSLITSFKREDLIFSGHNSFFVIYDKDNRNECDIYYLSEVKKWCYVNRLLSPHVLFLLNDGETIVLKNSGGEVVRYLRHVMGKKEVEKKLKNI
ncbi:MAG: hypothetical protein Q4C64_03740 [Erysipelotrichia bacterium]|nr:hypothetical protein [Erysipelotrichia bacterium]